MMVIAMARDRDGEAAVRWRSGCLSVGAIAALASVRVAAAEPPCHPSAVLDGEPDLTLLVGDALARRGVDTTPGRCPAVRASLRRRGTEITVRVEDPEGRSSERVRTPPRR